MTERRKTPRWVPGIVLTGAVVLMASVAAFGWWRAGRPPTADLPAGRERMRLTPLDQPVPHSQPDSQVGVGTPFRFTLESPPGEFYFGTRIEIRRRGEPPKEVSSSLQLVKEPAELSFTTRPSADPTPERTHDLIVSVGGPFRHTETHYLSDPLLKPGPNESLFRGSVAALSPRELAEGEVFTVWAWMVRDDEASGLDPLDTTRFAIVASVWWRRPMADDRVPPRKDDREE